MKMLNFVQPLLK